MKALLLTLIFGLMLIVSLPFRMAEWLYDRRVQ